MFSLVGLQAKAAALGAFALVAIGFFVRLRVVTRQRDKATAVASVLKTRNKVVVEQKRIKREEEKRIIDDLVEIEVELAKSDEEFEGLENFNEPNKF